MRYIIKWNELRLRVHYKILMFCMLSKTFMTFEKWWIGTFCRMSKNKILFSGTIHGKNHETLEHIEYSIQTKDLSANPEIGKISTSSSEAASSLIESQWDDITYRVLLMVFCPLMSPERSSKRKVIKCLEKPMKLTCFQSCHFLACEFVQLRRFGDNFCMFFFSHWKDVKIRTVPLSCRYTKY